MSDEATYVGLLHCGRNEQLFVGVLLRVNEGDTRKVVETGEVPGAAKTERELRDAGGIDRKHPVVGAPHPSLIEGSPQIHPVYGASLKVVTLDLDS